MPACRGYGLCTCVCKGFWISLVRPSLWGDGTRAGLINLGRGIWNWEELNGGFLDERTWRRLLQLHVNLDSRSVKQGGGGGGSEDGGKKEEREEEEERRKGGGTGRGQREREEERKERRRKRNKREEKRWEGEGRDKRWLRQTHRDEQGWDGNQKLERCQNLAISHHTVASSFLVCKLAFSANWFILWVQDSHPLPSSFLFFLIKTPGQTEFKSNF